MKFAIGDRIKIPAHDSEGNLYDVDDRDYFGTVEEVDEVTDDKGTKFEMVTLLLDAEFRDGEDDDGEREANAQFLEKVEA